MSNAATSRRSINDVAAGRGDRGCQRGEGHAGFSLHCSQHPADLVASAADTHKPVTLGGKRRAQGSNQDWRRAHG